MSQRFLSPRTFHPKFLRAGTLLSGLLIGSLLLTTHFASAAGNPIPPDNTIRSNVPMNEISIRAFRHFRRNFRTVSDESWFKSEQGYQVSFMLNACRNQAWYNPDGSFMCSVKFYSGKELDEQTSAQIHREFPGYQIKVVTEITNGEKKTFYMATIEDPGSIKTLMIVDGKIEIRQDLINGGA